MSTRPGPAGGAGPGASTADNAGSRLQPLVFLCVSGASTATVPIVGAGVSGVSGGTTPNSLGPLYNAYLMSQILGTSNASGNGSGSSSSSTNANSASTAATSTSTPTSTSTSASTSTGLTNGHFAATDPISQTGVVSGVGLPNVQVGIRDAPTNLLQAPLSVMNVAPSPLDPQNSSTSLPPVQAGDVVQQNITVVGESGATSNGTVAPAALPEPSPIVLLAVAFGIHLSRNWLRRHGLAGKTGINDRHERTW